ncbi:MAG: hypothetical protein ABIK92_07000 [Pseudomonadota bacterium]
MNFNPTKTIFRSPHSIEECHRRLKESVNTSFFPYFSSKQIAGRVSKRSISISKRIYYRNSFQTVLRASLKPIPSGTEIISTIGLHPFVKIFMFIWFGGLIIIGGIIFVIALSSFFKENSRSEIGSIMGILIPPGMAIFGIALLKFGKYLARDESKVLQKFLIDLLDAEEINHIEQAVAQGPLVSRSL